MNLREEVEEVCLHPLGRIHDGGGVWKIGDNLVVLRFQSLGV